MDCPYKVNTVGQPIAFAAILYGPKSTNSQYGAGGDLGPIRSLANGFTVVSTIPAYWQQDPNVSSGLLMQFNGTYLAGYYPAGGPGPWANDSGPVLVYGATTGLPEAYVVMTGRATVTPGYIVSPAEVVAQAQAPMRAVTAVDTSSFSFRWEVDGTTVSGNDDADYTANWSLAGPHQLRVFAQHAGGVDTIATTITVKLNLALFGSSSIKTGCPGDWSVTVAGGTYPLSYVWRLNGGVVGSNSNTYSTTVNWSGARTLSVDVTDSRGYTHFKSLSVVGTSTGTCQF